MVDRKFEITDARGGAAVGIRVVTQAEATEIAGKTDDGAVKVRLVASPAGDDSANEELINFLAAQLGIEPRKIEIVAGVGSRDKIVSIEGLSTQEVEDKLF